MVQTRPPVPGRGLHSPDEFFVSSLFSSTAAQLGKQCDPREHPVEIALGQHSFPHLQQAFRAPPMASSPGLWFFRQDYHGPGPATTTAVRKSEVTAKKRVEGKNGGFSQAGTGLALSVRHHAGPPTRRRLLKGPGRRGVPDAGPSFLVVVQFACGLRTVLPSEASPPGPLSVTGEGENSKKNRCVPPPLLSGRGGRGVRLRRAGPG